MPNDRNSNSKAEMLSPELSGAMGEIVIDALGKAIGSELISELPVIDVLCGISRTIINFRESVCIKNTRRFLEELNSQAIPDSKLEKYRLRILTDQKRLEEELGRILFILSETYEAEKARMLARTYIAYVNEAINWMEFQEITDVIRGIFIHDVDLIEVIAAEKTKYTIPKNENAANRLSGLGVISLRHKPIQMYPGSSAIEESQELVLTDIGWKFLECTR